MQASDQYIAFHKLINVITLLLKLYVWCKKICINKITIRIAIELHPLGAYISLDQAYRDAKICNFKFFIIAFEEMLNCKVKKNVKMQIGKLLSKCFACKLPLH